MAKRPKDEIKIHIDPRGGYGKSAKWTWSIVQDGKYLESGESTGARANAEADAREAIERWEAHQAAGKKGKPTKKYKPTGKEFLK